MKKIVVFGASSSKKSINKELSIYASNQFENAEIIILDLNDFEMPIFSEDKESKYGIPERAKNFYEILKSSNAIIISFAEHNGSYTAAFKNIWALFSQDMAAHASFALSAALTASMACFLLPA